jgi:hypothetical protein
MQYNSNMNSQFKKSPAGAPFVKDISELSRLNSDDWEVSAYRDVNGGGTGEEFVENLKKDGDSPGNKWYDCWSGETWIQADFKTPRRILFIQLKSANDCPERDPWKISFYIKTCKEDLDFTKIASYDNLFWKQRYQLLDFNFDTREEVEVLKILIESNRSYATQNHWGSGTQLAQIMLYTI